MRLCRKICLIFILSAICSSAFAQFSISDTEPTGTKWYDIHTSNFRVIYPRGCDSLAVTYLKELERFRPQVAGSLQMISGQYQKKPLDVVLHTRNASSNGVVTWTPSRMELYTVPQWVSLDPVPWTSQLAVHEGRHAAQMQMGYKHVFKPFYYILGQMMPGAACAWPDRLLLEGDAVVAETALTDGGRGRRAYFLSYYYYCFDNGDWRNWMKWRFGSYYRYTPDNYAFGYMLISGVRAFYDAPLFMADYMDYVSRRPYDPWPLRHTMRRTTGLKFRESTASIYDGHFRLWKEAMERRAPFSKLDTLAKDPRHQTIYSSPQALKGGRTVWIKEDIFKEDKLVEIDSSGRENKLTTLASNVMGINISASGDKVYWNEIYSDPRWKQVRNSVVRVYNLETKRTNTLKIRKGAYVAPAQYSGDTLAVISYQEKGGSSIDFYDDASSECYGRWSVPDTLQPIQIIALNRKIYALMLSNGGSSLCEGDGNSWKTLLEPSPVSMSSLDNTGGTINFTCDRTGVSEQYAYHTGTGLLEQLSSTPYGVIEAVSDNTGSIVLSTYGPNGSVIRKIREPEHRVVDWNEVYRYPVADTLSAQEKRLANVSIRQMSKYHWQKEGRDWGLAAADSTDIPAMPEDGISAPQRYRKGAHAFRFHSWAPCYVDIDNVANISYENVKNIASLGVMALFQNSMSTLYGYTGYKAAPDSKGRWFHSGHLNLTYSGLYPVFELQAHIGDGNSVHIEYDNIKKEWVRQTTDKPYTLATLKSYVPLSWNVGGWNFGAIPQFKLVFSNNTVENSYNFDIHAGIRVYAMQQTPSACIYPRWGLGAEFQYAGAESYGYLYGYIPGICYGQGLRFTGTYQFQTATISPFVNSYANLMPRGYSVDLVRKGGKVTLDYAIPFNMGDWHIFDMFYCKRGIVTPHFDWSYIFRPEYKDEGPLYSVGATFEMEFAAFFWVRTPVTVGVTYSYNDGGLFPALNMKSHHYVGATFNVSLPN